ncbi:hypothetical protein CRI94_12965 [Longibacter salinarum]|uniref:DUF4157 domain-containing protein n=1 Tax=Longibacter salinarum TaxID=1850348 RepID=A0A2A8CWZ4_9BACT|nr:hypothetical protein [Longibacter salinarum]PEN12908.1 hypothetical protein CRI94_12965 [Longibacter salinarum]
MNQEPIDIIIERAARWARTEADRGARTGRALRQDEISIARSAGVSDVTNIRIIETEHVPFPNDPLLARLCRENGLLGDQTLGLTLDHSIYLKPSVQSDLEVLAHECCHVAQVERLGSLSAFVDQYIRQITVHGYRAAPLELEAYRVGRSILADDRDSGQRTDGFR